MRKTSRQNDNPAICMHADVATVQLASVLGCQNTKRPWAASRACSSRSKYDAHSSDADHVSVYDINRSSRAASHSLSVPCMRNIVRICSRSCETPFLQAVERGAAWQLHYSCTRANPLATNTYSQHPACVLPGIYNVSNPTPPSHMYLEQLGQVS